MPASQSSLRPGQGRIVATLSTDSRPARTRLPELAFAYPLKLLALDASSSSHAPADPEDPGESGSAAGVKHVYVLGYGGGMLSGDAVDIEVEVGAGAAVSLLTQGSTKVYKVRRAGAAAEPADNEIRSETRQLDALLVSKGVPTQTQGTTQQFRGTVAPGGILFVLPEAVVPFSGSRFAQTQSFTLLRGGEGEGKGSLLLLDWFTNGRASRGEKWMWDHYSSRVEVFLGANGSEKRTLLLRDHVELSDPSAGQKSYVASLAPYRTHATLVLMGPMLASLASALLSDRYVPPVPYARAPAAPEMIWAASELPRTCRRLGITGCTVRIAGGDAEGVRAFVKGVLRDAAGGEAVRRGAELFERVL
ncbi:UreD urease accessory protein-domain-containing protein [Hyaloraphidium curvatum]|nr:UreD urease accessory protein-domain-containing protein [Hyaloraphidium curvatum]